MTPSIFFDTRLQDKYQEDYLDTSGVWWPGPSITVSTASRAAHARPQSGSAGQDPHSKRWRFRAFAESNFRYQTSSDMEVLMRRSNPAPTDGIHRYRGGMFEMQQHSFAAGWSGSPPSGGSNGLLNAMPDHTTALIRQLASGWTKDEIGFQETVGQLRSTIGTVAKLTRNTAKLLGRTVPTILSAAKGPKKRRREWAYGEAKRLLASPLTEWRKYPALWLEWNFGIAPIARDAAAAAQRLTDVESRERGNPFWEVYMRKSLMDPPVVIPGNQGPGPYMRPSFNVRFTDTYEQTTGVAMHFRIPRYVCGQYGGGQLSPLGTAWAFVPYSWLVDYVIPVGDWLQGMELAQIAPFFVEGSKSRKVVAKRVWENNFTPSADYDILQARLPSVLSFHRSDFRRDLMSGFPYMELLKPPTVDLSPSLYQLSLGLSALTTVMGKIQSHYASKG